MRKPVGAGAQAADLTAAHALVLQRKGTPSIKGARPAFFSGDRCSGVSSGLDLRFRRRQFPRYHLMTEAHAVVAAVAKRFVLGVATAAQRDDRPSGKTERDAGGIADFEFALDTDGAIMKAGDFGCGHSSKC